MSDLTHRDVITVLDRLDLEYNQMLQAKAALKHIRTILVMYQEAQARLETLTASHNELTQKIGDLPKRYAQEESEQRKALNQRLAPLHQQIAEATTKAEAAKADLANLTPAWNEAQRMHQLRVSKLDDTIKEKQAQLDALTAALNELRRKHLA